MRVEVDNGGTPQFGKMQRHTEQQGEALSKRERSLRAMNHHLSVVGNSAKRQCLEHPARLFAGAVVVALVTTFYAAVEANCASIDPYDSAGELIITSSGGSTQKGTLPGTRHFCPLYVGSSAKLSMNGTDDGTLIYIENLCSATLDCTTCPPRIRNASELNGAILLYWARADERLAMCGFNRVNRALAGIGLVGLGQGAHTLDGAVIDVPGYSRMLHRTGEYRDSHPRGGDAGILFPHFEFGSLLVNDVLDALNDGVQLRATVKRTTAPNPWRSSVCGFGKVIDVILIIGHFWIVEQASSNWIGHVRTSGLRFDLAQLALATEICAHLLMVAAHHDPFMAFRWGLLPYGMGAVLIMAPFILVCGSTLLLAAFWHQMVKQEGLASVAVESRTARIIVSVAVIVDVTTCYYFIVELLDYDAYWQWRLPMFNSFDYLWVATLTSIVTAATASYFVISALYTQRYLSNDVQASGLANKAAIQRLMRRVKASGSLLLIITIGFAVGAKIIFHPTAYYLLIMALYSVIMMNSALQIDSFAPSTGAPSGPFHEASTTIRQASSLLMLAYKGPAKKKAGLKRLAFVVGQGPQPLIRSPREDSMNRRRSSFHPRAAKSRQSFSMGKFQGFKMGKFQGFNMVVPEQLSPTPLPRELSTLSTPLGSDPVRCQSSLPAHERAGVSVEFLTAIVESWKVTDDMTTHDVCGKYVRPACQDENCCFIDLLHDNQCPEGWFATMNCFVSHWWGYRFKDLVAMIVRHDKTRTDSGEPVGHYFLDVFSLNQVANINQSVNMHQIVVGQLVRELRDTLLVCNSMVLCCSAGSGSEPGWLKSAPLSRIW